MTPRIGLMLYSLGPEMAQSPETTLQWVADEGFRVVELHRFTENTDRLLGLLRQHGFEHPTAHARVLQMTPDEQTRTFEAAAKLGVQTLIESKREAEYWQTPDDALKVAEHLNQMAEAARRFGLKFGYHLHDHEVDIEFDGQSAIEFVEPSLDPEMLIQIDTWWGTRGGKDLAAVARRLGTRVTTVHIKDGPTGTTQGQTAAGAGEVDIMGILAAAPHAGYATIEFDRSRFSGDIFQAVSEGRTYLLQQGLSE